MEPNGLKKLLENIQKDRCDKQRTTEMLFEETMMV